MEQREYIVEAEGVGQRIDRFLSGEDTGLSRSALQALALPGSFFDQGDLPAHRSFAEYGPQIPAV